MRKVYVVGLGPGDSRCLTAEARSALDEAHVLCGYGVYVDLVAPLYPEKEVFTTPMTQELERCRWALESWASPAARVCSCLLSSACPAFNWASPEANTCS